MVQLTFPVAFTRPGLFLPGGGGIETFYGA